MIPQVHHDHSRTCFFLGGCCFVTLPSWKSIVSISDFYYLWYLCRAFLQHSRVSKGVNPSPWLWNLLIFLSFKLDRKSLSWYSFNLLHLGQHSIFSVLSCSYLSMVASTLVVVSFNPPSVVVLYFVWMVFWCCPLQSALLLVLTCILSFTSRRHTAKILVRFSITSIWIAWYSFLARLFLLLTSSSNPQLLNHSFFGQL